MSNGQKMRCYSDTFIPRVRALIRKEFASKWAGQEEIKQAK